MAEQVKQFGLDHLLEIGIIAGLGVAVISTLVGVLKSRKNRMQETQSEIKETPILSEQQKRCLDNLHKRCYIEGSRIDTENYEMYRDLVASLKSRGFDVGVHENHVNNYNPDYISAQKRAIGE